VTESVDEAALDLCEKYSDLSILGSELCADPRIDKVP
jgi:hypothetical protein